MNVSNIKSVFFFLIFVVYSSNSIAQTCFTVDDFSIIDSDPAVHVFTIQNSSSIIGVSSDQNIPNVMGGWRHMFISEVIGFGKTSINILDSTILPGTNGLAAISQNALGATSERFQYNANGAGLNTNMSAINSFNIDFFSNDSGNFPNVYDLTVTLTDGNGDSALLTIPQLTDRNPHVVEFNIDNFININTIDLTDIDDISIDFAQAEAADMGINSFEICGLAAAVPVPLSPWILLLLTLVLFASANLTLRKFIK
jgi:hypothetical protein